MTYVLVFKVTKGELAHFVIRTILFTHYFLKLTLLNKMYLQNKVKVFRKYNRSRSKLQNSLSILRKLSILQLFTEVGNKTNLQKDSHSNFYIKLQYS